MVFGKKRKPPTGTPSHEDVSKPDPALRNKVSYRRPIPPATAVTSEVTLSLPGYCSCGGNFDQSTRSIHERYEQDIPLPDLTQDYKALLTTKQLVERGICLACGKAAAGIDSCTNKPKDLGGQTVVLGQNIKLLICHLVSVVGLSYAQTSNLVLALYNLVISEGEIATILKQKHLAWSPAYQKLKSDIRAGPSIHLDETPWPIQALGGYGYGWVMSASDSLLSCFSLESSRGAPHARKLLRDYNGIRITDDYGVYRSATLPGQQQLCWAHLYRSIKDVRHNSNLPKQQQPYVAQWYGGFASIYKDLRSYLNEPYDKAIRTTQASALWGRLQKLTDQPAPKSGEPLKLTRLKAQL